jgi:APA family basic amino acid/polyamine antiporter
MKHRSLFLRKLSSDPHGAAHAGSGLKRTLSAVDLTMLGIGAIIGAGLFSSIKDMIVGRYAPDGVTLLMHGAGPAVILSYLITAAACGFAALCYAEIAAMVPVSGSAYSYSYAAFGEVIAWIIGWDLIIEYAIGNVYVAQSWGDYFQAFLLGVNADWTIPLWLTKDIQTATAVVHAAQATLADGAATLADTEAARGVLDAWASAPRIGDWVLAINVPAFAITILLTIVLFLGIRESARANAVMVVLKIGLVLAFIGIGAWTIFKRGENHWTPFAPNGFKGIWQGAALGFFSYIGFDAVSTAGEETKNPQRDLPRGLIWSLAICTLLYVVTAAVLTGVVPVSEMVTNDPLAAAMRRMGYDNFATIFAFGAVIAMTAVLLVFQLGQTRIFMVMARDGLLPKVFSKIHEKHRTPYISTWVTGLIVAIACSALTPNQAIGLTNIGTLFAFILVALGVIVLRVREPNRERPFRVPFYPFTPILAILACAGLMFGLEISNWLRLVLWLAAGLVVYFAYGYRHSVLRQRLATEASKTAQP